MRTFPDAHDRLLIGVIAALVIVVGIVFVPLINVLVIAASFATVLIP